MTKIRVYEFAKEYNLTSREVIWALNKIGVSVKSHMSMIEDEHVEQILKTLNIIKDPKPAPKSEEAVVTPSVTPKTEQKEKQGKTAKPQGPIGKPQTSRRPAKQKRHKKSRTKSEKAPSLSVNKPSEISIKEEVVVENLAELLGIGVSDIIKKLMGLGIMANKNQSIDFDTASLIASEYDVEVVPAKDMQEILFAETEENEDDLQEKPPVVTVMGHVDHGKTSLLDSIRNENVVSTEAGGITQHIGAYQVRVGDRKITFLDTPGHEAFTAMRARGAQATDIAILVVAADDGVMPQTVEAINHAKAAKIPIIVAINKVDKPGANIDRVKQELTEHGLVAEEWGGETIMVPVSAIKRQGIDQLLEMILLVADMEEFKANPSRDAVGVVIEAKLDKGRGPVATILVQKGTISIGDSIIVGTTFGKVRAMINDRGARIKKATPSTPVEILGLADVPEAGEIARVVDDKLIRNLVHKLKEQKREDDFKQTRAVTLEDVFKQMEDEEIKELNVIVKADVHGSVEAMQQSLMQLSTDEVKLVIIHGGVGAITETDVMLASASGAIIIGFNVMPDVNARREAEIKQVDIRSYRVIYEAIDDIKKAMSGLLDPDFKEVVLGRAEVRAIFKVPKAGVIAGSYVTHGKFINSALVRIIRNGTVIHDGKIDSLKRFKDDVKEVAQGYEFGIGIENFNDIKEQDIIEAYKFDEIKREL